MITNHRSTARRRLDVPSLLLALVGLIFGAISYWLITTAGVNALVIVPSIVAATIGITHLIKREAPRG
ncbi:hypothetical protein BST10_18780 [Mycolicibacter algericus DSM 45454]|uniref:Uncharacterized protein n=2 Tax=Mycolicibacter algericus TaxID=1288388 RepID=A0A7I9Y411_MYCAL|nr:hypothetical protein BST10_18780 [Mycolicibacter algericus DSM 45454]GFG83335.1 hypothetical protein MALGJ_00110 [Mycolicibacter algericus]GFG83409.1 hypothetical protein MALGJ_00850 [Mycolicibacter algericus]